MEIQNQAANTRLARQWRKVRVEISKSGAEIQNPKSKTLPFWRQTLPPAPNAALPLTPGLLKIPCFHENRDNRSWHDKCYSI